MLPYFLERSREWREIADVLRARGVPEDEPALRVWREAAWCHLLLIRGRYDLIVARLKAVFREVSGMPAGPPRRVGHPAEFPAAVADLFEWVRAAVSVRYPFAFDRPAA